MRTFRRGSWVVAALVAAFTGLVIAADEDRTIPYSGRLEENGGPVSGSRAFVFRLYNVASGGAALATFPFDAVDLHDGLFAVELGPVSDAVLAADPLYVEVAVGASTADAAVLGRQRVFAVPYAMRGRGDATFAIDRPVAAPLIVDGAATLGRDEGQSGVRSLAFEREGSDDVNAGKIAYRATWDVNALSIVGAGLNPDRLVHVWDDLQVQRDLDVGHDATVHGDLFVDGDLDLKAGSTLVNVRANSWCDCQQSSERDNGAGVDDFYLGQNGSAYYQCRGGRFLVGIWFNCDVNKTTECLEQFKCCRPCGLTAY